MGCSSSRPEKAEETGKPLPKLETVLHVDAASNGLPPPEHPPTSPAAGQTASSRAPPQAPAGSSYKGAVAPQNEAERLSVLKGLGVLEEVPDLHLDRICEALVQLFKVPVALVSLVDAERQFFKSAAGSVGAKLRCTSTDRNVSFCAWTLLPEHAQMLIVEDATQDARFSGNPLVVGDPFLRFYAGAPLVSSSGHRLGALCLHDYHARKLDADSCNMLCNFAEVAVRQIELAHVVKIGMDMNEATEAGVLRGPTQGTGVMLLDVSQDKWHILYRNELLDRLAGSAAFHHTFFDMLSLDGQTKAESWEMLRGGEDTWKQGQNFVLPAQLKTSKQTLQLEVDFRLAAQDALDEATEPIGIPSFVRAAEPDKYLHIWFATIYVLSAESKASRRPQAQVSPLKDVRLGPLITKTSCGRLYRATWKDKMAVVKVIGPRPAGHHGEAPGQAEAELSSKLKHPNIVETLMFNSFRADKGAKEGQDSTEDAAPLPREKSFIRSRSKDERSMWETWILREAWDKGSLEDRVAAGEFLLENASSAEALASMILRLATAAEQVAEALRYMHEQGIVHGGLTAEKIAACYTTQGQESVPVYKTSVLWQLACSEVCDLEQAHQGPKVSDMLHYGDVAHMAPELVSEGRLTEKCDIYAFGLLMWEMATGQHPWAGMSDAAIIEAVTENCQMPPLPVKAPSALKALIKACLAHEADDRPQPDAIVTALQHICKTAKTAALANGIASQPGFADFLNA